MKSTIEKVSVIGLGKLGLPTLTFFASCGCSVIGVDHSKSLVADLAKDTKDILRQHARAHLRKCPWNGCEYHNSRQSCGLAAFSCLKSS
jgi:UDP-N-acetyl-D-mannosaminuronate dehydrogenase